MSSYPTKSPAATCTLDAGFQIEWHPAAPEVEEREDGLSVCASSCSCPDSHCGSQHGSTYSLAPQVSYLPTGDEHNTLLASDRERIVRSPTPTHSNSRVGHTLYPNRVEAILIPQSVLHRAHCCNLSSKVRWTLAAFGLMVCELIPWIVGFTLIIYFYRVLGVGPGMGILLIMVLLHGLLRFLKAHGDLNCYKKRFIKTQTRYLNASQIQTNRSDNGEHSNSPDEVESELESEENTEVISEVVCHPLELPPSYEAAVTKPPPYDLNLHLTPNDTSYLKVHYVKNIRDPSQSNNRNNNNLPSQMRLTAVSNSSLPSYEDVISNLKADNQCQAERTQQVLVTDL